MFPEQVSQSFLTTFCNACSWTLMLDQENKMQENYGAEWLFSSVSGTNGS